MSIVIDVVKLVAYLSLITAAVVFCCCCVCMFAVAYSYFKNMPRITKAIAKHRDELDSSDAYRSEVMRLCASMVADGHLGRIMSEIQKTGMTINDEATADAGARLLVRNAIRLHETFEELIDEETEADDEEAES